MAVAASPPPVPRGRRRFDAVVIVAALLMSAASFVLWRLEAAPGADAALVSLRAQWFPGADVSPGWRAITMFGDGGVLGFLLGCGLLAGRRALPWSAAMVSLLAAGVLCTVLKMAIGRVRPDGIAATSWPSGHAAAVFAVGAALLAVRARAVPAWLASRRWLPWVGLGGAVLATASRVVVGRHYPSDVLAGGALGLAVGHAGGTAACALAARAADRGRAAWADAAMARALVLAALLAVWWARSAFGPFVGEWLGWCGGPLLLLAAFGALRLHSRRGHDATQVFAPTSMATARRRLPVVLAGAFVFAAALAMLGAGRYPLLDVDEPRFAQTARGMLDSGDWLVPRCNGAVRYDKPPLVYWLQALAYRVLDVNPFAARLPSAFGIGIAAALTTLLAWWRSRRLDVAAFAGLVLATAPQVQIMGHAATADALLLAGTTLAIAGFVRREHGGDGASASSAWWFAAWGGLGLSLLVKGPPALVAPLAVLAALRTRTAFRCWPLGVLLALALPLAWFVPANAATGGGFLTEGLGHHVLARSLRPFEGHGGFAPWWLAFYPLAILLLFFPWSVFLPAAWRAFRRRARAGDEPAWTRLAIAWTLGVLVVFTLVASKLPHYVLPLYPLLAVEVSRALLVPGDGARAPSPHVPRMLLGLGLLAAAGPLAYVLSQDLEPMLPPALSLTAVLLVTAFGAAALARRASRLVLGTFLAMAMTVFTGTLTVDVLERIDRVSLTRALVTPLRVRTAPGDGQELMALGFQLPSLVFELNRTLREPDAASAESPVEQAIDFVAECRGFLLVRLQSGRELELLAAEARSRDRADLVPRLLQPVTAVRGYLVQKGRWYEVALVRAGAE